MNQPLFVQEQPSLNGFPTSLLPHAVTQVLLAEGFRVIARLDNRRVWLELSGLDVAPAPAERPDLGLTHWSLTLEAGIFGMHIVRSVMTTNGMPYAGVVYSGNVAADARFMKGLLAHCICPDSKVWVDEETLTLDIETMLREIFDVFCDVRCAWHPIKKRIAVEVTHPHFEPVTFSIDDSADVKAQVFSQFQAYVYQCQPA